MRSRAAVVLGVEGAVEIRDYEVPEPRPGRVTEPLLPDASGDVSVPEGPGIGVELDHAAIEPLTVQQA